MVSGFRDSPFRPTVRCRSSRDLYGGTWARQGFARCARRERGLDPPGVLPLVRQLLERRRGVCAAYRYVQGPPGFQLAANGSPVRACSRWLMQEPPKFSHDLGQRFEVTRAISGGKRFPVHLGPSRPERSVHSARRRRGACHHRSARALLPARRDAADSEQARELGDLPEPTRNSEEDWRSAGTTKADRFALRREADRPRLGTGLSLFCPPGI